MKFVIENMIRPTGKLNPPFKFDFDSLLKRAKQLPVQFDGITLNFPFISVSVKKDDTESNIAREIVIRLSDKRVLNSFECCDNCINEALSSLQEIRSLLVDKQVELSNRTDGALYLLIEMMLEGIRQFLTFEQKLKKENEYAEAYFSALEMLRAHLYRTLKQIGEIASIKIPKISDHMRYDSPWEIEAYKKPKLSEI